MLWLHVFEVMMWKPNIIFQQECIPVGCVASISLAATKCQSRITSCDNMGSECVKISWGVSVQGEGVSIQGGVSVWGSLSGGGGGGFCLRGLCPGGCLGGSLSRGYHCPGGISVQGVSAWGGPLSRIGGLYLGVVSVRRGYHFTGWISVQGGSVGGSLRSGVSV